jgi:hypothetical protein
MAALAVAGVSATADKSSNPKAYAKKELTNGKKSVRMKNHRP